MTPSEQFQAGADSATELLSRRTQLQEWLSRLDDVGGDIPAQVASRVRADYEQRLAAVVTELSAHSEALSADRERLDERLLAVAERHDAGIDALEEARLRHRIGELSEEEWNDRRPGLEAEVESAAVERAEIEGEISALEDLFAQISAAPASDEITLEAGSPAEQPAPDGGAGELVGENDFAEAAAEWNPELPTIDDPAEPTPAEEIDAPDAGVGEPHAQANQNGQPTGLDGREQGAESLASTERQAVDEDLVEITNFAAAAEALAEESDPAPADEDYAFLQELDRAIAATSPHPSTDDDEPSEETRPQPGLKCPDCGYSNDPAAWYCGVCGVDLG